MNRLPVQLAIAALLSLISLSGCQRPDAQADGQGVVLLVIGDSLSAGYRLDDPDKNGWVSRVEERMRRDGFLSSTQDIVNASVSGETTTGGLARLPDLLREHRPARCLIELGANDMLRRQPMAKAEQNLSQMAALCQAQGAQVAILAVELPGIAGLAGGGALADVYEKMEEEHDVPVIDYPLDDLFNQSGMMLEDRMHPSLQAQPVLAEAMLDDLKLFLSAR